MFTCSGHAVVTTDTRAQNLHMIYRQDRLPEIHGMTIFANICSQYVGRRPAGCLHAIVARTATRGDAAVIELDWHPGNVHMADIAFLAGLRVIRRFTLTDESIVTTRAGSKHFRMIDSFDRRPVGNYMTRSAILRSRRV